MSIIILIKEEIIEAFKDLVRSTDIEVAGFLLGITSGNSAYAKELVVLDNVDLSPYSFRMDPYGIVHAYRLAEILNFDVVALIHSHPAPSYPSIRDIDGMKLWPIIWVIVSSIDMGYRAWIIRGEILEEVEVVLTS